MLIDFASTTGLWYGNTITEELTAILEDAPAMKLMTVMAWLQ